MFNAGYLKTGLLCLDGIFISLTLALIPIYLFLRLFVEFFDLMKYGPRPVQGNNYKS